MKRTDTETPARLPDRTGVVERDGVRIHWEAYGATGPAVVLLPTWSVVHSRHWKGQIPYLSRHFRVVTFDGRGNGLSGRPNRSEAYADAEFIADAVAVMDAAGFASACVAGLSLGAHWALMLAAAHPERVDGAFVVGGGLGAPEPTQNQARANFEAVRERYEGWHRYNRHVLLEDYGGYLEWFMAEVFSEPHSTKQIETASPGASTRRRRRSFWRRRAAGQATTPTPASGCAPPFGARSSSSTGARTASCRSRPASGWPSSREPNSSSSRGPATRRSGATPCR